jgi:hypothetical protein
MDINKLCLVMDIWEGDAAKLDMPTLYANGVRGMIVRLNDTVDKLHFDEGFKAHWAASENFYHIPYYVFGPWMTAIEQYQWIVTNCPADVKVIALDVELDSKLDNQAQVAQKLDDLVYRLQQHGLKVIIYSGSWWWNDKHIAPLPIHAKYDWWWAAYPFLLQPNNAHAFSTWENLKALIGKLDWMPDAPSARCKLWQVCSRFSLPGTGGQAVDINIFNGVEADLKAYMGGLDVVPPPPVSTGSYFTAECLVDVQNVRSGPSTSFPVIGTVERGRINPVIGIGGGNVWVEIAPGRWVAVNYLSSVYQKVSVI